MSGRRRRERAFAPEALDRARAMSRFAQLKGRGVSLGFLAVGAVVTANTPEQLAEMVERALGAERRGRCDLSWGQHKVQLPAGSGGSGHPIPAWLSSGASRSTRKAQSQDRPAYGAGGGSQAAARPPLDRGRTSKT